MFLSKTANEQHPTPAAPLAVATWPKAGQFGRVSLHVILSFQINAFKH
jgi:hypothetical protein